MVRLRIIQNIENLALGSINEGKQCLSATNKPTGLGYDEAEETESRLRNVGEERPARVWLATLQREFLIYMSRCLCRIYYDIRESSGVILLRRMESAGMR